MRFVFVLHEAIRAGELEPAEDVLPDPQDGGSRLHRGLRLETAATHVVGEQPVTSLEKGARERGFTEMPWSAEQDRRAFHVHGRAVEHEVPTADRA